jgi:hypothetical protein
MSKLDEDLLSRVIEVDEAVVGGFEPGAIGRSKGKWKNIQVAVELGAASLRGNRQQMIRAKAKLVEDLGAGSLQRSMDGMIKKSTFDNR